MTRRHSPDRTEFLIDRNIHYRLSIFYLHKIIQSYILASHPHLQQATLGVSDALVFRTVNLHLFLETY